MSTQVDTGAAVDGSLKHAPVERLVCLQRHWMWADEAMARFDRELADGWDYDDDPMSDRPFGAYYHWCALLCAFGEAALDHGLLSPSELEPIRQDLEACLPGLRASRQLLVVIPASLEKHPRVVDLLRDGETLSRLRRLHLASGEALRKEHMSREIDHWIRRARLCSSWCRSECDAGTQPAVSASRTQLDTPTRKHGSAA